MKSIYVILKTPPNDEVVFFFFYKTLESYHGEK